MPKVNWAAKLKELMDAPKTLSTEAQFESVVDKICTDFIKNANIYVYEGLGNRTEEFIAEFESIVNSLQKL